MKRTEKIEIRVSAEEKARLTAVAERERRTVSQMLRELASEHIKGAGEEALRPREDMEAMTPLKRILYIGGGAALGIVATLSAFAFRADPPPPDIAGVEFTVWRTEDGGRSRSRIVTGLSIGDSGATSFELPIQDGQNYRLSGQITEGEDDLLIASFNVCRLSSDDCVSVATPTIMTGPDDRGRIEFSLADATHLEIDIVPPKLYGRQNRQ